MTSFRAIESQKALLLTRAPLCAQAQTLEQRRRNAKFVKDQEARRGKSEDQIKKRTKEAPKSPISMFWLGMSLLQFDAKLFVQLDFVLALTNYLFSLPSHPWFRCLWRTCFRSLVALLWPVIQHWPLSNSS